MNKKKYSKLWLLIGILILIVAVGCSPSIKTDSGEVTIDDDRIEITDEENKEKITIEDGTMEMESEDGTTSVQADDSGGLSLPDGYPEEIIPIIDGANITFAARNQEEGSLNYGVVCVVEQSMDETYKYYEEISADWQDKYNMKSSDFASLGGSKGEYEFGIMLNPGSEEDSTEISINIGQTIQ